MCRPAPRPGRSRRSSTRRDVPLSALWSFRRHHQYCAVVLGRHVRHAQRVRDGAPLRLQLERLRQSRVGANHPGFSTEHLMTVHRPPVRTQGPCHCPWRGLRTEGARGRHRSPNRCRLASLCSPEASYSPFLRLLGLHVRATHMWRLTSWHPPSMQYRRPGIQPYADTRFENRSSSQRNLHRLRRAPQDCMCGGTTQGWQSDMGETPWPHGIGAYGDISPELQASGLWMT